jgi:TonB family protein
MRSNPLPRHVLLPVLAGAAAVLIAGCGRSRGTAGGSASAPDPRTDAGRGAALSVEAPAGPRGDSARSGRTSGPTPIAAADSAALPRVAGSPAPVPEAAPSADAPELAAPFTPPVLRQPCSPGTLPGGRHATVELELRVNEDGVVDQFRYASGSADTVVIRAALDCVRVLRFDPARRGGEPVPAWCRRTFTFPGR